MPSIHVCSLARISATVAETRASHLVSLINDSTAVVRPDSIVAANHLFIGINDIVEPQDGMVLPGEEHVSQLIDFAGGWRGDRPMVVHCYAGISRSTAGAFITFCVARPERDEFELARRLRAASPFATPNPLLIAIADDLLDRRGRMVDAIAAIGRGKEAFEGNPFGLTLEERA